MTATISTAPAKPLKLRYQAGPKLLVGFKVAALAILAGPSLLACLEPNATWGVRAFFIGWIVAACTYVRKDQPISPRAPADIRLTRGTPLDFKGYCDFAVSIFLKPDQVADLLEMLTEKFEHEAPKFGEARANFLYAARTIRSAWPILQWLAHRALAIEAIKRML